MKKAAANPFLLFLPFLLLYVLFVIALHNNNMYGDEWRYVAFAKNLVHGFYSPKNVVDLWNGPGYPIVLMPFVAFDLPKISMELLNAVFHYLSVVYFYKAIVLYTSKRTALITAVCWALYYISYQEMSFVFSESLTLFLASVIIYALCQSFLTGQRKYSVIAGAAFGYMVLVKVVFWYVLVLLIVLFVAALALAYAFKKLPMAKIKRALVVLAIAFIVVSPYLAYTYSITGRPFYIANSGGMSLYWMSTPVEGEYGDWNSENFGANCNDSWNVPCNADLFAKNHQQDINYVLTFSGPARDDAYKRLAMHNIKSHPVKYLRNCMSNMGRLWFNFPFSYFYQRDKILLRLPPNAILLVIVLIALPLHLINLRRVPTEINFIALMLCIYLFVSMLVSAYQRQFYVIVPLLLLWSAYIITRTMKIKAKIEE